nr:IS200/IS605 family transposase [uncultured Desulfobulbus sp.]
MYDEQSLSHTKWDCKYHVILIPKYRKKSIFGDLRKYLGEIFRELARQKECTVIEEDLMPDHVHILLSIPPKYSVSQIVGFIKGKSAIQIARNFQGRKKNFVGQNFWARGYYVSTVGKDEEAVRVYIQHQEKEDKRMDQLNLFE